MSPKCVVALPDIRVSDWGPRIWGGASGGPIPRSCRVEDPEDPEEGLEDPGPQSEETSEKPISVVSPGQPLGQDERNRHALTS